MLSFDDFREHCLECGCNEEKDHCTTRQMTECAMRYAYSKAAKNVVDIMDNNLICSGCPVFKDCKGNVFECKENLYNFLMEDVYGN